MIPAVVADIAVERTVYHFDKPFSYSVPADLQNEVKVGCRVLVPFGAGNTKRQGMVLALRPYREEIDSRSKPIFSLLDAEPVLSEELVALVSWVSEITFCTLFDAVKLMLPTGLNRKMITEYALAEKLKDPLCDMEELHRLLPEGQWNIVALLREFGKPLGFTKMTECLAEKFSASALEALVKKEMVIRSDEAIQNLGDATARMIRLEDRSEEEQEGVSLTAKQKAVVEVLREIGAASVKEACYYAGVTEAVLRNLEKKGILSFYEKEIYRDPYRDVKRNTRQKPVELTPEQENAYRNLVAQAQAGGGVSLLYGVTGSGKTSVFLQLIRYMMQQGKNVIVMVPEISLTPQMLTQFHDCFGKSVAVFHSALSMGERMDEWKRVKKGEARIVIGTRSAVFAPMDHIGLIVMDEEQEYTYKSDANPRFHARDIARFRCAYHKGLLVLSSATPSVESFYAAQSGKYTLNRLSTRFGTATLPQVQVVDMQQELRNGNRSVFSNALAEAIDRRLAEKKQAILLLNRRGYRTFLSCKACGEVVTCPNCSISLTYHSANNRMMCHYCGYSVPFSEECPGCHQNQVRFAGAGTQKAEEELAELFPEARILRMDTDTTMAKFSHEEKLDAFLKGEYDILIGTQMVAKGLNFENVTLVGVLSADQSLYGDDFRSYERSFSLLTQVVGRSGRGKDPGVAIVQTTAPEHPVIRLASEQDYDSFYQEEIMLRKLRLCPPFSDICVINFVGLRENSVQERSQRFMDILTKTAREGYAELPLRINRPTPAVICKINQKYHYKIVMKCKNGRRFREMLSRVLREYGAERRSSEVAAFADMNPDTIL